MKQAPSELVEAVAVVPADAVAPLEIQVRRGPNLTGLLTLFWLALRQHGRGVRLIILSVLFLLPTLIVGIVWLSSPGVPPEDLEKYLVLYIFPHVLVPLAALLYASGMIRDEIEDQTLTYLLIRPLPRWGIYLTKLLATLVAGTVLTGVFTFITYGAIVLGQTEFASKTFPERPLQMAGLFGLNFLGYSALFGLISLFFRRALVVGVIYIALFEGLLANIEFAFRYLTVVFYYRVLCARWLELNLPEWRLDLATAPSAATAVQVLTGAALAAAISAALLFARREFRVKTPEGS